MAERVFRSAGVSTREIDLSAPAQNAPVGVPAGIIGTSDEGPAFVPITVSNTTAFQTTFGSIDGTKFGPIAVAEYLRNAQSATYMRVLGIGDGKKRNSTSGIVTNAGFVVGNRQVQKTVNGALADNPFANSGEGSVEGRTYFLGCFMSESAGSTVFSSAGIQNTTTVTGGTAATATITITDAGQIRADNQISLVTANGDTVTITGHADTNAMADTTGASTNGTFAADTTTGGSGAENITQAAAIATTINLHDDFTATNGGTATVTITQNTAGTAGNGREITVAKNGGAGDIEAPGDLTIVNFSGGLDGNYAVPILRGVLLAPSGVILHLSGNSNANNTPVTSETAGELHDGTGHIFGKHGAMTGSVDLGTEVFTMLLNGHKSTTTYPNVITASFSLTNEQQYFRNVFNTDPKKIEEAGHLLYASYDVHPNLAAVTGSGAIKAGVYSKGCGPASKEDVGFLLTSSLGRNVGSSTVPNFEDFQDRFNHAESPYIISQKYGGSNKNLFKVVALSAGARANTKIKIAIDNIARVNGTTYPTFDLSIRDFFDTDETKITLESFRSLTLDPDSPRFIGRVIGDLNVYFDFDKETLSQKINVNGDHPVLSSYIRLVMTDDLKNGNIPVDAMPMGFRGPLTLNTSGSILAAQGDGRTYNDSDVHQRVQQPPLPYRRTIALGTGNKKRVNTDLNWGLQFNRKTTTTEPNKQTLFDETFTSLVKYFPDHRKDVAKFNRASDSFQNNKFCLENISVKTGSNEKADPDQWVSASYVRSGIISANSTAKTRGLLPKDFETPSNRKFSGFNVFLQNGFDGLNIFDIEKSKLSNTAARREMLESGQGLTSGPTVAAYRKAVDIMGSKSDVDIKLLAIPGLREPAVTDFAITAVESRFDAMYIMDIEQRDKFNKVITGSNQVVHVGNTVNAFKGRGLDSSFAAAYFPDVVKSMRVTTNGRKPTNREALVNVPPSVVALGAFALNDAIAHPWFAPAGFSRGSLNAVKAANVRLNRENLDELYDVDINPITAFPGTGLVIWGQKTLLQNSSALDRVNVRRLLIDVRRAVRNVANTLLFEPNRQETLERFNSLVNPILQRVQEQGGVDRFKVIIDTTTTTQADVENNTIRGKIFLQPTRAVEFVALDFVVTNAGADAI